MIEFNNYSGLLITFFILIGMGCNREMNDQVIQNNNELHFKVDHGAIPEIKITKTIPLNFLEFPEFGLVKNFYTDGNINIFQSGASYSPIFGVNANGEKIWQVGSFIDSGIIPSTFLVHHDTLYIYFKQGNRIISSDLLRQNIYDTTQIENPFEYFTSLGDDLFVTWNMDPIGHDHMIVVQTTNYEILEKFQNVTDENRGHILYQPLWSGNEGVLASFPKDNKIYSINRDSIRVKYNLQFLSKISEDSLPEVQNISRLFENENWLAFSYIYDGLNYILYSRNEGRYYTSKTIEYEEILPKGILVGLFENEFYLYVNDGGNAKFVSFKVKIEESR